MSGHWGDVDVAQAEHVRAVMDANGAEKLPFGGRACGCPHGTGTPECCIQQLGLQ